MQNIMQWETNCFHRFRIYTIDISGHMASLVGDMAGCRFNNNSTDDLDWMAF